MLAPGAVALLVVVVAAPGVVPLGDGRLRSRLGAGVEAGLSVDQTLELAAIQEDPLAGGALVDRDAVALIGAHLGGALGAEQNRCGLGHSASSAGVGEGEGAADSDRCSAGA